MSTALIVALACKIGSQPCNGHYLHDSSQFRSGELVSLPFTNWVQGVAQSAIWHSCNSSTKPLAWGFNSYRDVNNVNNVGERI